MKYNLANQLNNEKEWVVNLKKGNKDAFRNIFEEYARRIFVFAKGYLKSNEEAEEVVQEVFIKVWNARTSINTELSFKSYLFKITFNYIRELFLKKAKENNYKHEILGSSVDFDNRTEEQIDYHSLLELVDKMIDKLPPRQKEIIVLHKKQGILVKDISIMLEISPRTVEKHLSEALKHLKQALSEEHIAGLLFFSLFLNQNKI
ncbi:MAG TPA: RNA polymerase sigma-70 factor [Prolixibacteraceae bacterium]|nr:RNA polymerase sigma-70 factor [Marinilabiliales bacterium]HBL75063.1 RNA polymerase sigma-70 factor [Prolixibacteraceae bacterium]HCU60264.1 RNA polymerase sigma-70 factor [Prolixibacteraceae bacterium]